MGSVESKGWAEFGSLVPTNQHISTTACLAEQRKWQGLLENWLVQVCGRDDGGNGGHKAHLEYSPGLGNPDQRGGGTCIPLPSLQSP